MVQGMGGGGGMTNKMKASKTGKTKKGPGGKKVRALKTNKMTQNSPVNELIDHANIPLRSLTQIHDLQAAGGGSGIKRNSQNPPD